MGLITTANDERLASIEHDNTVKVYHYDDIGSPAKAAYESKSSDVSILLDSLRAALLAKEEAEGQAKRLEAAVGWALENGEEINTFHGRSTWKRELRRRCAKEGK